mmetsp:Transcript_14582/g.26150  ORF Transcript_14582/g.26150 Transcript_14582/m.26150 type:complete len:291 (-) Transcript_14582:2-874(-)
MAPLGTTDPAQRLRGLRFIVLFALGVVLMQLAGKLRTTPKPVLSSRWKSLAAEQAVVVCMGDTHGRHELFGDVPDGDVLVFTGDATDPNGALSNIEQIERFNKWLGTLPHKFKVVVAGNHDPEGGVHLKDLQRLFFNAKYVQDEVWTMDFGASGSLRLYGSPWQSQWEGDPVFETYLPEGPDLAAKWDRIPSDIDILATHSPPRGKYDKFLDGKAIGSTSLMKAVKNRIRPKVHCYGHVHPGRTVNMIAEQSHSGTETLFVNGAICDNDLNPIWTPVVLNVSLQYNHNLV